MNFNIAVIVCDIQSSYPVNTFSYLLYLGDWIWILLCILEHSGGSGVQNSFGWRILVRYLHVVTWRQRSRQGLDWKLNLWHEVMRHLLSLLWSEYVVRGAVPALKDHTIHVSKVQEIFLYISPMPFHTLFRSRVNTYQSYVNVVKRLGWLWQIPVYTCVSAVF